MQITPAILEGDFNVITDHLGEMRGVAHTVQIDICDGVFVPSITWPYTAPMRDGSPKHYDASFKEIIGSEGEIGMPYCEEINIELDLMIADPKRLLPDLLTLGPSKVIFHIESLADPVGDIYALRKVAPGLVSFGIAINPQTSIETLFPILDEHLVSSVQCMGIDTIGVQGSPFNESVLETIKVLREKYSSLHISVDGGVDEKNILALKSAGASECAVGHAIWNAESPVHALQSLKSLVY
jgi:ribulose-phosphate 3-epimerase